MLMAEQSPNKWLKSKNYVLGLIPSSWQGRVALVVYIVTIAWLFIRIDGKSQSGSDTLISFVPLVVVLTSVLLFITYQMSGDKKGKK